NGKVLVRPRSYLLNQARKTACLCQQSKWGRPHDSRRSRLIKLLPSALSIVKGILSWSRWGSVHNEIPFALIKDCRDMDITSSPVVVHYALRAYRISSCNIALKICARDSYKEFSGEATISVKHEATNCDEPCSRSVETVTSVHCCI